MRITMRNTTRNTTQNTTRNTLLCGSAGMKEHPGGHVLFGDELFHSKDHFPVTKRETKIIVSTEEKGKKS